MFDKNYIVNKVKQNPIYRQLMDALPADERKKVEMRMEAFATYVSNSVLQPVLEAKIDNDQVEEFRKEVEEKIKQGKVVSEKTGKKIKPGDDKEKDA